VLGDGKGGFTGNISFPGGNLPTWMAVGDFNGDGRPDFAYLPNFDMNQVNVQLQTTH